MLHSSEAKNHCGVFFKKKGTPAPSEVAGKFYILMDCFCLELVKSKGDCFKQPEN